METSSKGNQGVVRLPGHSPHHGEKLTPLCSIFVLLEYSLTRLLSALGASLRSSCSHNLRFQVPIHLDKCPCSCVSPQNYRRQHSDAAIRFRKRSTTLQPTTSVVLPPPLQRPPCIPQLHSASSGMTWRGGMVGSLGEYATYLRT